MLLAAAVGFVPVGVEADYGAEGLLLAIRVGPARIALGGGGEKPSKEKKPPRRKKPEASSPKKEKPRPPAAKLVMLLMKNGFPALGRVVSRFRVRLLRLHVTAGSPDPAEAAMLYAAAGTGMDALMSLGGKGIRRADLRADVDFDADAPVVELRLRVTLRVGAAVGEAARFGFGFFKDYIKLKKEG